MENQVELYLSLIIEHFELLDESVESLKNKLDYTIITKHRILFTKTKNQAFKVLTDFVSKKNYNYAIHILKKYADEIALNKYMENEGYKFVDNINLNSIKINNIIIFPTNDTKQIFNYLHKNFNNEIDLFKLEHIDEKYSIIYS